MLRGGTHCFTSQPHKGKPRTHVGPTHPASCVMRRCTLRMHELEGSSFAVLEWRGNMGSSSNVTAWHGMAWHGFTRHAMAGHHMGRT